MGVASIDGLPIINAKKAVKLHITKNDIRISDRKVPDHCAAAVACKREMGAKEVRVHLGRIYVRSNNSNWQRFMTPKNMRTEIIAYDRGGEFEPGEYILAAPSQSKTGHQGSQEAAGARSKRPRKGKPRAPKMIVKNVRVGPTAHS